MYLAFSLSYYVQLRELEKEQNPNTINAAIVAWMISSGGCWNTFKY